MFLDQRKKTTKPTVIPTTATSDTAKTCVPTADSCTAMETVTAATKDDATTSVTKGRKMLQTWLNTRRQFPIYDKTLSVLPVPRSSSNIVLNSGDDSDDDDVDKHLAAQNTSRQLPQAPPTAGLQVNSSKTRLEKAMRRQRPLKSEARLSTSSSSSVRPKICFHGFSPVRLPRESHQSVGGRQHGRPPQNQRRATGYRPGPYR